MVLSSTPLTRTQCGIAACSNNRRRAGDAEARRSTETQRCRTVRRLPGSGRLAIAHPIDLLDQRSRNRASRAMRCLPFSEAVYRNLQEQGLDAGQLLNNPRLYQRKKSWYRNSDSLENDLLWLICVGVLRREVDGQGLTSRFRLTPLGRQLLDDTPDLLLLPVSWKEWLQHWLRRRIS